jgi:hypothetical protein
VQQLTITPDNYVIKDGLKVCRIDGDELVFYDRNPARRKDRRVDRGEADVRVNVLELVRAMMAKRG